MQAIIPNLWFNGNIQEALDFYTSTFANSSVGRVDYYTDAGKEIHGHEEGDILSANFTIEDMKFTIINGGDIFSPNPSISFTVNCLTNEELDQIWINLSQSGEVLMPLDTYPFSDYFGWLNDKFGVSWQLIVRPQYTQKVVPALMYTGDKSGSAEEAINFYTSVFPDSHIGTISRYPAGMDPEQEGTVNHAEFSILNYSFTAMDSAQAHKFTFSEGVSLMVTVDTQDEIDNYWNKLSAVPDAEACGWLKDKYGVSWQIVPSIMNDMQKNGTPEQLSRVTSAYMQMKKFDIATLQAAYNQ
jgi:predicted 3-demethylubiquinone-9 3-methyltransferase (glyoxalase superfamily)